MEHNQFFNIILISGDDNTYALLFLQILLVNYPVLVTFLPIPFCHFNNNFLHQSFPFPFLKREADKSKITSPNLENMIKMLMSSWDVNTTD